MRPDRRSKGIGYVLRYPLKKVKGSIEAHLWRRAYRSELAIARETARPGPLEVVLVLDHLNPHGNPGLLARSCDALGARAIHTVGMPYVNIVPSVGSLRNIPLIEHESLAGCLGDLRRDGYAIYALEPARNVATPTHLDEVTLPTKTAFIVGNETTGVSFTPEEHPYVVWLTIRQFGVVPCLNAAIAGSIALYEYARQHGPKR